MNSLKMVYPNLLETHFLYNESKCDNHFQGNIRKSSLLEPECRYYGYTKQNHPMYLYTNRKGQINKVMEYGGRKGYQLTRVTIQELKDINGVQFKTTKVMPYDATGAYQSIQRLDIENGLYSVVRKKDDKIIGGYEINLRQPDRKFAKRFKGRLEKLALYIATDVNGCERNGLRNIGDLLFKLAKRIK